MFTGLLLLFIVSSSTLPHWYKKPNKIMFWLISSVVFVCSVLICSNRATMGLVFNAAAPDVDFFQTLDSAYFSLFITHLIYALLGVTAYLVLRIKFKIAPPMFLCGLLLFSLLVYFPGVPSADGDNSYGQFLAHSYSDWQPPLFTIWWNIFKFHGVTFLINLISYYAGLIYISYYLWKNNYRWQNDLLVIFCFNPLLFTQLAIIWKDIGFTAFLIDCAAIYLAQKSVRNLSIRTFLWSIYFVCLFLAVGFRLNGIFAVIPFIFLALKQIIPTNYARTLQNIIVMLSSLAIMGIFLFLNNVLTYKIFDASKLYPQSFVMLSDMAYIECNTDHEFKINLANFVTPSDVSRDNLCNNQILNLYNNDALFNQWSGFPPTLQTAKTDEEAQQIKQDWLGALSKYPLVYLEYRAQFMINDLFFQYWYPTAHDTSTQQNLEQIAAVQHYDMKFIFSLFLIGATFAVLFNCIRYKTYGLAFYLLISNLLQLFSWYLFIPAHAARYFFWNDLAMLLAIVLFAIDLPQVLTKAKVSVNTRVGSRKSNSTLAKIKK